MKQILSAVLFISMIFFSCKKESSPNGNRPPEEVAGGRSQGKGKPSPPVANAGPDQTIILPTNTVTLNGSASTDPNNDIRSYLWTKIWESSSSTIVNPNAVQTQVNNLISGVYKFELKVTDARGLFDRDTVQITVLQICGANRPTINANLVTFGTLSQARTGIAGGAGAGKIVFAGGFTGGFMTSSRVDFFDITTQSWSTAELSEGRAGVSVAAVGNKIFFAGGHYYEPYGGRDGDWFPSYVMDVFDVTTNAWSVVDLPYAATYNQSAVVDNKIFFSDGFNINIYDVNTQSWSTIQLSDGRPNFSMVAANNKVYFAGGSDPNNGIPLNRIDIYDNATNTWSVSSLAEAKHYIPGIVAADKVYFAGGYNSNTNNPTWTTSCSVDIIDANTGTQSVQNLSRQWFSSASMATMNNKIAFIPYGELEFDIYNIATNTWSIGVLTAAQRDLINGSSILSGNNTIYVTGGSLSNIVYKLEF